MQATVGNRDYWKTCFAWLVCGGPNATEAGTEPYRKPDRAKARALLKESGYSGEKVVLMRPTGVPMIPDLTEVAIQDLKDIGLNVDVQTMEWSVLLPRRYKMNAPDEGGWNLYITFSPSLDLTNPDDEPRTLRYANTSVCPMSADGEHRIDVFDHWRPAIVC